ncbi:MAG: hypothetical protein ACM31C_00900 [Acidobacteriota bacterium]
MAQPLDTSAIQQLVARARRRIRLQWALEGATTATIVAAATALLAVFAMRTETVSPTTGLYLLIVSGLVVVGGAIASAARRLDAETVARKIDRASNLADRLSTAIAFERALHSPSEDHVETHELMAAAVRDGVRAVPRANVRAATPFAAPRDWRAALGFLGLAALVAGLAIPTVDRTPRVLSVTPDQAPPGFEVLIEGQNLTTGVSVPLAAREVRNSLGGPQAVIPPEHRYVPPEAAIYLGTLAKSRPVVIEAWSSDKILAIIPQDAPLGDQKLMVFINNQRIGMLDFKVVDKKDINFHSPDSVVLDPDEKAYVEAILAELKNAAQKDQVPELDEFAKKIEDLLTKAENGEITKEQLLDALAKAEDALNKNAEPDPAEVQKQMAEMGKELAKDQLTKELGEALEKNDLEKAKQEMEKLAEKLDKKELSEQQKQELAKKLDQVAKQMEKKDQDQQKQADQRQQKLEEEIRRLEKQKEQAKNDQQRQDLERRLEDKQRELKKLQKEQEQKQQSEQRRAVKRLQKDMEKAAENLKGPQKPGDQQDQDEREKQASQKLKDAARETGRVDEDRRKQATQRKMSSQMDDLREAMRRARQKGNKGPQDPFNKNRKNQDFISRARGQKSGQGQSWKPGQGLGQGSGSNGSGGNGQQPGGKEWGTGHDDNLTGDPTQISGNDKDLDVQGKQGKDGGSTRETILSAAQKGFASTSYSKVYADYQRIVEEVMRTEKLPSSYKYYVKRYFAKIHPEMQAPAEDKK